MPIGRIAKTSPFLFPGLYGRKWAFPVCAVTTVWFMVVQESAVTYQEHHTVVASFHLVATW